MKNQIILDDILGDDDDDRPSKPAIANRKDVLKKKKKAKKNTKVKKTEEIINSAKPAQNEVDGTLNSGEQLLSDEGGIILPVSVEENVSSVGATNSASASVEDPEDDDESEEEGILGEICMLV